MTIKEVAKIAGVSSAAVSRYLNNGYISEEKKEKIKDAIERTGYKPSIQARSLRNKKARLVGVVVPKINSESISRVTAGVESVLSSRGYSMLLAATDNTPSKEVQYLHIFESYPVDGIILVGTVFTSEHRSFFRERSVPLVVIGQKCTHASCIYHNDYEAGRLMGEFVASTGKKNVAYIGVKKQDKAVGVDRREGFVAGLRSGDLKLLEKNTRMAMFTIKSGYEQTMSLLQENTDIDIISCATDNMAAGAIGAIKEYKMGKYVDRISVTGFGDNQLLKAVTSGIPTIHFSYMTSGVLGAQILLDEIETEGSPISEIKLGCKLVGI